MLNPEYWTRWQPHERIAAACPVHDNWLTTPELSELHRLKDAGRRLQWRHGRWLAKQLLTETVLLSDMAPSRVAIVSRDAEGRAVRPTVRVDGVPVPQVLSISHTAHSVLVGLADGENVSIGVDLAVPEEILPSSLVFWFSECERADIGQDAERMAMCWAVKEAVYKCCNRGESFVPGRIETELFSPAGRRCRYNGRVVAEEEQLQILRGDRELAVTVLISEAGSEQDTQETIVSKPVVQPLTEFVTAGLQSREALEMLLTELTGSGR